MVADLSPILAVDIVVETGTVASNRIDVYGVNKRSRALCRQGMGSRAVADDLYPAFAPRYPFDYVEGRCVRLIRRQIMTSTVQRVGQMPNVFSIVTTADALLPFKKFTCYQYTAAFCPWSTSCAENLAGIEASGNWV
jgi:hypothetical protein